METMGRREPTDAFVLGARDSNTIPRQEALPIGSLMPARLEPASHAHAQLADVVVAMLEDEDEDARGHWRRWASRSRQLSRSTLVRRVIARLQGTKALVVGAPEGIGDDEQVGAGDHSTLTPWPRASRTPITGVSATKHWMRRASSSWRTG